MIYSDEEKKRIHRLLCDVETRSATLRALIGFPQETAARKELLSKLKELNAALDKKTSPLNQQ